MKQKTLKYPLIVSVSLVWGLIIYKVVNGLGNNETVTTLTASQKKIDYNQPLDSFSLMTDYPDPFIPKEEINKDNNEVKPAAKNDMVVNEAHVATAPKPVFDPSIIQYTGMISNPETKLKVAILTIAGKEYLAKEKEKLGDYKVKSITKEKVVVFYKGVSYNIERSK